MNDDAEQVSRDSAGVGHQELDDDGPVQSGRSTQGPISVAASMLGGPLFGWTLSAHRTQACWEPTPRIGQWTSKYSLRVPCSAIHKSTGLFQRLDWTLSAAAATTVRMEPQANINFDDLSPGLCPPIL